MMDTTEKISEYCFNIHGNCSLCTRKEECKEARAKITPEEQDARLDELLKLLKEEIAEREKKA